MFIKVTEIKQSKKGIIVIGNNYDEDYLIDLNWFDEQTEYNPEVIFEFPREDRYATRYINGKILENWKSDMKNAEVLDACKGKTWNLDKKYRIGRK